MTIFLNILGIIFLIFIYIKLGIFYNEKLWYRQYSLEAFFAHYLKNPFYGICNLMFNLILWPIGIILNFITMKFWRPKNYIKPHIYE